ncbi:serine protease inhibitor A3N [Oryzias melastigma]|uniref:Thyroxine-binding globulin n=1 Tax=Oryzias melastigma TaxID=30732 RepID=A0A3B3DFT5_ORYME|nr:serine protease inhibitor A3N [Oryzias melastigma]
MAHAAVILWMLAVVCVGKGHQDTEGVQDTAVDSSTDYLSLVTSANQDFAFSLYRKLANLTDSQDKNIFYSPRSVSLALAALAVGARGETHRQLFSTLGFNSSQLTQADVDLAFRSLLTKGPSDEEVSEGTAVFLDDNFKPKPEFLDVLKQSYSAEGFNVDFSNTTDSVNTINKYVADKTKGKIDKLVDGLDPDILMYLINFIYFKGTWDMPFDPMLTKEDMFNVDENKKVPVQMMNMEEYFDVYHDQAINTTVLQLKFNSSYSMLLLLPGDMGTLEQAISPEHVSKWMKWKKSRKYDIYVPKFSIKTSYKLNDVLAEMGITDVFGDSANLSGIAEDTRLAVSEVVHQASLDVDEKGATAAGATGIGFVPLSFQYIPVIKFNRPFMVIIIDNQAQNVLFMGKIINPNI